MRYKCADRNKTGHRNLIARVAAMIGGRHRVRLEPREKVYPSASNCELILYDAITGGGVFDEE